MQHDYQRYPRLALFIGHRQPDKFFVPHAMSDIILPQFPGGEIMSEFELLAEHRSAQAEKEQQRQQSDNQLLAQVLAIYDQKYVAALLRKAGHNAWRQETLHRWLKGEGSPQPLTADEITLLREILPQPPAHHPNYAFRFIDLFAGIGGIRYGFEAIGGQCVFTSEWNKEAVRTYNANWFNDQQTHKFHPDIREVTLSHQPDIPQEVACTHINDHLPDHDVLLAGFPCQPFSLAGVSKKFARPRTRFRV